MHDFDSQLPIGAASDLDALVFDAQPLDMPDRSCAAVIVMTVLAGFASLWLIEPAFALAFGAFVLLTGVWIWIDDRAADRDYNDEQ